MECLHIGTAPSGFNGWASKTICIHNFLDLPDAVGEIVRTPTFDCFGHTWDVFVYPGGYPSRDGSVCAALSNLSLYTVTLEFKIILMKNDGSESDTVSIEVPGVENTFAKLGQKCYGGELIKRSKLVEERSKYLRDGTLTIKVNMRLSANNYVHRTTPKYPIFSNMGIFLDDETSDVAFNVKGELVVAHKCIIKAQSESLYVMCESSSKTDPMIVEDVEPALFRIMLASLYGQSVVPEVWKNYSQLILAASRKYGFRELREEAEEWYVKSLTFTVDNVVDEFLAADGNGNSLVREATREFIAQHGAEITQSESFARLHESLPLMKEIMKAVAEHSKKRKRENE